MIPRRITVHCSDSENGKYVSIETIKQWHLARGFNDIGYHLVIAPDGTLLKGRDFHTIGAHVADHNQDNVGICLVGRNKFTSCQFETLRKTVLGIQLDYKIHESEIWFHKEFNPSKTCPNMDKAAFMSWLKTNDLRDISEFLIT